MVLWARALMLSHLRQMLLHKIYSKGIYQFLHTERFVHCDNVCVYLSTYILHVVRLRLDRTFFFFYFSCCCVCYFSSRPMVTLFSSFVVRFAILRLHHFRRCCCCRCYFAICVPVRIFPPNNDLSKQIKCSAAFTQYGRKKNSGTRVHSI